MGKSNADKRMEVRRTRNKLAGNLDKLESAKHDYTEKAKVAYRKGDKHSYSLARSGLAATLSQQKRTREMLLNIDITTQMRDTGDITEEFLTSMDTVFKRLRKINKSVDIKSAQKGLRNAIIGMENVQAQLDAMLLESEDAYAEMGSVSGVSDAEIDRLLGISAAADEQEMGEKIDDFISAVEREKEEQAAKEQKAAPQVQTVGGEIPSVPTVPPQKAQNEPKTLRLGDAGNYIFPPVDLLGDYGADSENARINEEALDADARAAEEVLEELGVPAKVVKKVAGPAFSRLEMVMPTGMSVQKIDPLENDIAMRLGKSARFEVPLEGKNAFGVEFASAKREIVGLREIVSGQEFTNREGISYALAVDIERKPIVKDLTRAPHMIIAGSTGSGKSCFLHSVITSLMYKYTPAQLRMAMVDFKRVEMAVYNGIPHLLTDKVVDCEEDALELFKSLTEEMEKRYELLLAKGCRNVAEYNSVCPGEKLPYIAVFVDEYADISTSTLAKEFDACVRKLSQKARASGIHLVLATQRPSTDVISGTIKNNFPVQIAFKVARKEDSRTTLAGQSGAETLLGGGDMLYNEPSGGGLKRYQAPYVSTEEVKRIVSYIKNNR